MKVVERYKLTVMRIRDIMYNVIINMAVCFISN